MRRIIRGVLVFAATSVVAPIVVTVTIVGSFIFLPLPATLPTARPTVASQISHVYDAHGKEIGIFREFEQNIPVRRQDIPDHLKEAVIAAEDRGFYSHGGIDLRGMTRALWADVRNRGAVQGGSTITQQYVKNTYVGKERTVVRKVREAVLASQLDRSTDKEEILFRYLSTIYLGDGTYGIGAASESYFRKPASQLTLSESALLAGLIPAPSRYAPRGNPEGAELKRKLVLDRMLSLRKITPEEHAAAYPLRVHLASAGPPPGPATLVYPPRQQLTQYPYFVDYVRRYLIARYGPAKVFRGGLRIQTTLEPDLQVAAEKAVAEGLRGTTHPIEMSLVAVEPPTGYVKALVGGRDFATSEVNLGLGGCYEPKEEMPTPVRATCWDGETIEGGGTGRQPGSAFKPFVLAAAFAKGFTPARVYPAPNVYRVPGCNRPKGCDIHNYEGASFGSSDLRRGTWKSINTVYAQLISDVGVEETAEMTKKLGVTSAWYSPRVHGISYALGTIDVSPLDMASAYGVFAARGIRAEPTPIVKVVDNAGRVLEDNVRRRTKRVLEEVIADNITDVLRGVITSGTGTRANIGRPAAGKTGTAQEFRDAWFVGYTPTLSTAVWMGNEKKPTPLRNIKGVRNVAGGTIPAGVWKAFMSKALAKVPVTEFKEPAPIRPLADALKRKARSGFDAGTRRPLTPVDYGGPYEMSPPPPKASPPTSTTTTTPRETTTTTEAGGFPFP